MRLTRPAGIVPTRRGCADRAASLRPSGVPDPKPRATGQQGRLDRLCLGGADRLRLGHDDPHQRSTMCDWRQWQGAAPHQDRASKRHPLRRHGAGGRSRRGGGRLATVDALPRAARQALDRRSRLHQYEWGTGAGVFQRRHYRGYHHRAVPVLRAVRHRPELELPVQGQVTGHTPGRS